MAASTAPLPDLTGAAGIGVAGNFAGHLDQAGEAADFVNVRAAAPEAPKGIFPWYVPGAGQGAAAQVPAFLAADPLSSDRLRLPADAALHVQLEPEVGVVARVRYDAGGAVAELHVEWIGAFDDCSIRRPGARRISEKKNWGAASKGIAARGFALSDLSPGGPTAGFRLACFLRRDGAVHAYGVDSPLPGYSYYGARLLDWIAERLRAQAGAEGTPLEPVGEYLRAAGRPPLLVIGIGATRYTAFGETGWVRPGDEAIVVVYDAASSGAEQVAEAVAAGREDELPAASVLRRRAARA